MKKNLLLFIAYHLSILAVNAGDTLYFRLSNPWNTVKDANGGYIRKCVKENDYFHVWDFNNKGIQVTESFYSDTTFTRKLFCHRYFNEKEGYLEQTRCYENGRLHGYFVNYDEEGDTTAYDVYDKGELTKSWSLKETEDIIFTRIEQSAEFPGGREAWIRYLQDNLTYPKELKRKKVSGQVLVRYMIDTEGKMASVEILKSLHKLIDEEVIRVIMASPAWQPARQNGMKVKAYFTMPITF